MFARMSPSFFRPNPLTSECRSAEFRRRPSRDISASHAQGMADFRPRQMWRLTIRWPGSEGARARKDVKNEGTSGDVYENTGDGDNKSSDKFGLLHENARIAG
jgi:hypothetical protein